MRTANPPLRFRTDAVRQEANGHTTWNRMACVCSYKQLDLQSDRHDRADEMPYN
jgi:hypothetical protein